MENLIINHWAVLACAVLSLVLGAFWYSPLLFYKGWKDAGGAVELPERMPGESVPKKA